MILHFRQKFQSTLPRRERHNGTYPIYDRRYVSIHAPAKGATIMGISRMIRKEFQSTLPRRERHIKSFLSRQRTEFQSTLPRRERPIGSKQAHGKEKVSIHAPAKGATVYLAVYAMHAVVSIHAPAKGATCLFLARSLSISLFQSTLPRRERRESEEVAQKMTEFQSTLPRRERLLQNTGNDGAVRVSIHAPAKGATRRSLRE